jgi:hypothetical protein
MTCIIIANGSSGCPVMNVLLQEQKDVALQLRLNSKIKLGDAFLQSISFSENVI